MTCIYGAYMSCHVCICVTGTVPTHTFWSKLFLKTSEKRLPNPALKDSACSSEHIRSLVRMIDRYPLHFSSTIPAPATDGEVVAETFVAVCVLA